MKVVSLFWENQKNAASLGTGIGDCGYLGGIPLRVVNYRQSIQLFKKVRHSFFQLLFIKVACSICSRSFAKKKVNIGIFQSFDEALCYIAIIAMKTKITGVGKDAFARIDDVCVGTRQTVVDWVCLYFCIAYGRGVLVRELLILTGAYLVLEISSASSLETFTSFF